MSKVVLVTGAGRGIGLELARRYAVDGWTVLATVRDVTRQRQTEAMIRASELDHVIATAEADDASAVRWLSRLGFEPAARQPIERKVLFVWERGRDARVAERSSATT